jgi:hypothetical protein
MSSSLAAYGSTTQHRVLEIPEILELIFSFLDDASNARNATVCKRWFDLALNIVWRNVTDLHRLFSLLAPMYLAITTMRYDSAYKDRYVSFLCTIYASICADISARPL